MPLVAWDANVEQDIAGYRLEWSQPGVAVNSMFTNGTAATVLVPHGVWTFSLRAISLAGLESDPATLTWTNAPVYSDQLERADSLTGPWCVETNLGVFQMIQTGSNQFYRVRLERQ